MCFNSKCSVFSRHFRWAPKRAGLLPPLLISWPHLSPPWGPMGMNVVCCSLKIPPSKLSPSTRLVFLVPAPPPPPFKGPKCLGGDCIPNADCIPDAVVTACVGAGELPLSQQQMWCVRQISELLFCPQKGGRVYVPETCPTTTKRKKP